MCLPTMRATPKNGKKPNKQSLFGRLNHYRLEEKLSYRALAADIRRLDCGRLGFGHLRRICKASNGARFDDTTLYVVKKYLTAVGA